MSREEIQQFLSERRIGIAGMSRNSTKLSNHVSEKLKQMGREVIPVHPEAESIGGDKCVRSAADLPGDVKALMLIASPAVCTKVLRDVSGTAVNRVWVFPGKRGDTALEAELLRLRESGVGVISGLCPFMFLEPVNSVHAFHRFFVRLFGSYPR